MSNVVYFVELTGILKSDGTTTKVFGWSSKDRGGYLKRTADTGLSADEPYYAPRVVDPGSWRQSIVGRVNLFGKADSTKGTIRLANLDGGLNTLRDYAFDGRTAKIMRGELDSSGALKTGTLTTVLKARVRFPLVGSTVVVDFVDRSGQFERVQLQPDKFLGNTGTTGIEGSAQLAGRPKPHAWGTIKDLSPPLVASGLLMHQLSDTRIRSISKVTDGGDAITVGSVHSTLASLMSATVTAARYDYYLGDTVSGNRVMVSDDDGETWTAKTSAADNQWFSVIQTNTGRLVAVAATGTGNRVMVSDDNGETWATKPSAADNQWYSVTQSSTTRLVAVSITGSSNRVMVSDDDGDTWTSKTSAANNEWLSVIQTSTGRLVAVAGTGTGNRVMVSDDDGDSWTTKSSAADNNWSSVVQSSTGRLVTVARTGTGDRVMVSDDDGDSWTTKPSAADNQWGSVTQTSTGRLVAVASTGTGDRIMVSDDDGETWETKPSAADNQMDSVIQTTSGRLVAIASTGNGNRAQVSDDDGETWETRQTAADNRWFAVTQTSSGRLVAVAITGSGSGFGVGEGAYIRLGTLPSFAVTVTFDGEADASISSATDIAFNLLERRLEYDTSPTSEDVDRAALYALENLNDDSIGLAYLDEVTISQVFDNLFGSIGAWWGIDRTDRFTCGRLELPDTTATPDLELTVSNILGGEDPDAIQVIEFGILGSIPVGRVQLGYGRNYTVLKGGLLDPNVTAADRGYYAREWRLAAPANGVDQDTLDLHPLSAPFQHNTYLSILENANVEQARLLAMLKTETFCIRVPVRPNVAAALPAGGHVKVTVPYHGMDAGLHFTMVQSEDAYAVDRSVLTLWGGIAA